MSHTKGHKHALILSGGGAHGAYEIGVMKALFTGASPATNHEPLEVDVFTGTSVGAYNASFMASQPGIDSLATLKDLEHLWLDRIAERSEACGNGVYRFRWDVLDFLSPKCMVSHPLKPLTSILDDVRFTAADWFDRLANFAQSKESVRRRALELFDLSTLIDTGPMDDLVRETIDFDGIRRNEKALRIAATNWETGEAEIFDNQHMNKKIGPKAVLASAAIPGIFPVVEVMETPCVDGGLVLNTPLKPALACGADVLHVVYVDPNLKDIPVERFANTLSTFDRMFIVAMSSTVNRDIKRAQELNNSIALLTHAKDGMEIADGELRSFVQALDLVRSRFLGSGKYKPVTIYRYRPRKDLGGILGLLNFDRERIEELIQMGYDDAVEHDFDVSEDVIPWTPGDAAIPDPTGEKRAPAAAGIPVAPA